MSVCNVCSHDKSYTSIVYKSCDTHIASHCSDLTQQTTAEKGQSTNLLLNHTHSHSYTPHTLPLFVFEQDPGDFVEGIVVWSDISIEGSCRRFISECKCCGPQHCIVRCGYL